MRFLKQTARILAISFAGEVLKAVIPLPIPASVYGLVILLVLLCTGLPRVSQVREAALFLIEIMPVMFIPAAVGLITSWAQIRTNLLAYLAITLVSTVLVMAVSGRVAQRVVRHARKEVTPK